MDENTENARPSIKRPITALKEPVPETGTDTVCVALKLPNGIIIQDHEKYQGTEATPMGFRQIEAYRRVGPQYVIKGNAQFAELQRRGMVPNLGGYALTHGVPKEVWDRWLEANKDSDIVRNGLIFACSTESETAKEARANSALRSGLEPIDPKHPELTVPRLPKRNPNVTEAEPGTRD